MHQFIKDKYRTNKKDYTVNEMLKFTNRVFLTQKLLGNVSESGAVNLQTKKPMEKKEKWSNNIYIDDGKMELNNFQNVGDLASRIRYMKIYQFQALAMQYKGHMPKMTKAMAKRMLLDYNAYMANHYRRERASNADPCDNWYRIKEDQAVGKVQERLFPLTLKQYNDYAEHVWQKRGAPKYYKKEITGCRFGAAHTYKDRNYDYIIKRYVGVQTVKNATTGKLSVKMGIINEKKNKISAGNHYA
jgi:hypothetical protein